MSARYPLVRNVSAFSTRFGVLTSPSRSGFSPSSARSVLIRSCISLFYISALLVFGPLAGQADAQEDADALYADRANLASARRAAALWTAELRARPENFELAWKLARITYWLGTHASESERREYLERGIKAADTARALEPRRPEGYFWAAANMGAVAESFGLRAGLKYRKPIKDLLETVLKMDPAFMQGSADRALGRWYHQVPRMFGGNHKTAEAHLRASLKYNPDSTISRYFLAELLIDEDRLAEARSELAAVIKAPLSADWAPEDADYKEKARQRLAALK